MNQVIFCINPRDEDQLEDAYMVIQSICQSSQGLLVAVLYCFTNSQVQAVVRAAYCRALLVRSVNQSARVVSRRRDSRCKRQNDETIL